jgi:uncharacterized membrane protein SirB2
LFECLKLTHVSCAFLSVAGFVLRGWWMATDNALLRHRLTRTLPHVVDTVLLGSAIAMLVMLRLSPLAAPWLMAKIIALLLYIGLGMVALRFGKTGTARVGAWVSALLVAGYLVSVAYSKSPWGFFAAVI